MLFLKEYRRIFSCHSSISHGIAITFVMSSPSHYFLVKPRKPPKIERGPFRLQARERVNCKESPSIDSPSIYLRSSCIYPRSPGGAGKSGVRGGG
jgi:hypothetical protein